MNLYRFVSPGYFYLYRVYPEDKARTDQAKNAIAMFYQEERQRRYEFWVKYDKPRETARAFALRSADQDWRRRIRAHAKEILRARHLPLSTPIIALALPRKAKRPGI
jgi:hypothetical protein